ncbi:hypothetical protein ES332_A09G047500v1 [Gossypium tomentosum]|uniref:Uncharacterized protein n=1 Tax=Gossypium tomentosum TaxID=34277 RepID=A0A5D2NZW0_GOSTO|nr:hypothetical protein ES332_A09G047500v1 [Gossypium tomentosum]
MVSFSFLTLYPLALPDSYLFPYFAQFNKFPASLILPQNPHHLLLKTPTGPPTHRRVLSSLVCRRRILPLLPQAIGALSIDKSCKEADC